MKGKGRIALDPRGR